MRTSAVGDPTKWVVITGDIVTSPEGSYFYPPVIADPNPRERRHDLPGLVQRLAHSGLGRRPGVPGGQLLGVHHVFRRTRTVATSNGSALRRDEPHGKCAPTTGALIAPAASSPQSSVARTRARSGQRPGPAASSSRRTATLRPDRSSGSGSTTCLAQRRTRTASSRRSTSTRRTRTTPGSRTRATTPTRRDPGHVFEVTYNPGAGTATWTNLDGNTGPMGDLPTTDLVRDDVTGDLYASTDFGVMMLAGRQRERLGCGRRRPPDVEVAGLTIVPGARKLYAATHGRAPGR